MPFKQPVVPSPVKQLKLPSTYRTITRIDGHILRTHYALRALHSGTGGHETVWAERESFGPWKEITLLQFQNRTMSIIESAKNQ